MDELAKDMGYQYFYSKMGFIALYPDTEDDEIWSWFYE